MSFQLDPTPAGLAAVRADVLAARDGMLERLVALDPAHWPAPATGDPLEVLEVARANRMLRQGIAAPRIALHVAIRRALREHTVDTVRAAVSDLADA